jgi:hypothetical protein
MAIIAASSALALVLVGGGAWAVIALRGAQGGAASPEDAAKVMLESVSKLDGMGAITHIAPSERQLFAEFTDAKVTDKATGEAYDSAKDALAKAKDAITIELTDLTFQGDQIAEGVNRTAVTGGSVRLDADVDALADAVIDGTDALQEALGPLASSTGLDLTEGASKSEIEDGLDEFFPVTKDIDDLIDMAGLEEDGLFVVTVEEDGKWFTSISMTVAQYAFESSGGDPSDLADPIPANEMATFSSGPDAAAGFVDALDALAGGNDLREFAKVLPLAESRLIAVYGPALVGGVDELIPGFSVSDFEGTKSTGNGSYERVSIDSLTFAVADVVSGSVSRAGDTWTVKAEWSKYGEDYSMKVALSSPDSTTWKVTLSGEADYLTVDGSASVAIPTKGQLHAEFDASSEDGYSSSDVSGELDIADGCVDYSIDMGSGDESDSVCGKDLGIDLEESMKDFDTLPGFDEILALTTLKDANGSWYVSPTASVFGLFAVSSK